MVDSAGVEVVGAAACAAGQSLHAGGGERAATGRGGAILMRPSTTSAAVRPEAAAGVRSQARWATHQRALLRQTTCRLHVYRVAAPGAG